MNIVPDELCPHVEIGAEMAGGVLFTTENPPIAVGMCAKCLSGSREAFETLAPIDDPECVLQMTPETLRAICIAEGRSPQED